LQISGSFKRQVVVPFHPTSQTQVAQASGSPASNGKLVAKLAESSNEQWWCVGLWWFQRGGPPANIVQGFALAGAFVRGRAFRQTTATVS